MKWFTVSVLICLFTFSAARAADVKEDVYVVLYQRRLAAAEAAVDRHRAQLDYDRSQYDMMRNLYSRSVTSRSELDGAAAKYHIAVARVKEADIVVLEAQSMLEVARARRTTGLEMPICPTILQ
jgi:multidrug resistance efflux pump